MGLEGQLKIKSRKGRKTCRLAPRHFENSFQLQCDVALCSSCMDWSHCVIRVGDGVSWEQNTRTLESRPVEIEMISDVQ